MDSLDFLERVTGASNGDSRTYTNTGFLDLDALTGGAGTVAAVAVTVTTLTRAIIIITSRLSNSGGTARVGWRCSGATTIASTNVECRTTTAVGGEVASYVQLVTALTAGSNTFELQANVSAGTGTISEPRLIVVPLPT